MQRKTEVKRLSKSLSILATLLLASSLHAAEYTGKVVSVADGDTITVLDSGKTQHKVRLAGIDAPEKGQPFGNRSRISLALMVYQREVTIQTNKIDRYGREVGKVLHEGEDVCLAQVKKGLAWHYKAYEREQSDDDRNAYAAAEEAARAGKAGLWADASPMAPWEWRKTLNTSPIN
jgi:endonuclease YncB( thermonuclease family)